VWGRRLAGEGREDLCDSSQVPPAINVREEVRPRCACYARQSVSAALADDYDVDECAIWWSLSEGREREREAWTKQAARVSVPRVETSGLEKWLCGSGYW